MKIFVAALFGAGLMLGINAFAGFPGQSNDRAATNIVLSSIIPGAVVGAGVQLLMGLTGIS